MCDVTSNIVTSQSMCDVSSSANVETRTCGKNSSTVVMINTDQVWWWIIHNCWGCKNSMALFTVPRFFIKAHKHSRLAATRRKAIKQHLHLQYIKRKRPTFPTLGYPLISFDKSKISYGNLVTFICDRTIHQKCYQIKWWNMSSEYNLYNMKPS